MNKSYNYLNSWIIGICIAVCLAALCGYGYKKIDARDLDFRDGVAYIKGTSEPYTGKIMALWAGAKIRREASFVKGKLNGTEIFWFKNGKREFEKNWDNGIAHGRFLMWFEDGKKRAVANYKYGKPHGVWTYWYDNGNIKSEEHFNNGERDGAVIKWYRSGVKQYEQQYHDGKRDGTWTTWHLNGQKEQVESYTNNLKHGAELTWDTKGTLLSRVVWQEGTILSQTNYVQDADVPFWKKKSEEEDKPTEKDFSFPIKLKK